MLVVELNFGRDDFYILVDLKSVCLFLFLVCEDDLSIPYEDSVDVGICLAGTEFIYLETRKFRT